MSRSCPRVASPSPARSTLITSAPNQASNCVQVGPDWTCVKSRMRTPSKALVIEELLSLRTRLALLELCHARLQGALLGKALGLVAHDRDDGVDLAVAATQQRDGECDGEGPPFLVQRRHLQQGGAVAGDA